MAPYTWHAGALQELLLCNRSLLTEISTSVLTELVTAARSSHHLSPRLLALLTALVARPATTESTSHRQGWSGAFVPVHRNQTFVTRHFLLHDSCAVLRHALAAGSRFWSSLRKHGFSAGDAGGDASGSEGTPPAASPLSHLSEGAYSASGDDAGAGGPQRLSVHAVQELLRLCTRLCLGRVGSVVRHALQQHAGLTLGRLQRLISDSTVPYSLRAVLTDLLRVAYVAPQLVGSMPAACSAAAVISWQDLPHEVPFGFGAVGKLADSAEADQLHVAEEAYSIQVQRRSGSVAGASQPPAPPGPLLDMDRPLPPMLGSDSEDEDTELHNMLRAVHATPGIADCPPATILPHESLAV